MAHQVVAAIDLADDVGRIAVAPREDRVRHPDERHQRGVGGLEVAVGRAAEDGRRLPAVHEAAEHAAIDVRRPARAGVPSWSYA